MNIAQHISEIFVDDYGPDSTNNNLISEASLSRLYGKYKTGGTFAIITAYRYNKTKRENIQRNRDLRSELNKRGLGVQQLVGHWRECQDPNVSYKDCPKNQLVDAIERSYFVSYRENQISLDEFRDLMIELARKFEQDGVVFGSEGDVKILEKNGNEFSIGSKLSLGKVAQAYSQHVKKLEVPFVFEGVEVPGTNFGAQIMNLAGVQWTQPEDLRECKTWEQICERNT